MGWRLHNASLTTQLVVMLGSVALVAAALTFTLVTIAVQVSLAGADPALVARTIRALGVVVAVVVGAIALAAVGAGAYLRAALGDRIAELQAATAAIARGGFGHRIASRRRDELGRLAASIDAMAAQLDALESSRRRMLAAVSHELRTPLTIIRGHAFTLGRSEHDTHRASQFELIDAEVERLASLVDALLEAATLRAAPVQLQRRVVPVADLLANACARFERAAVARDVRLVVREHDAVVDVDVSRVDQVLANLVGNAVSHAPVGSNVMLGVRRRGSAVRVSVRNAGPGIAADEIESIFEPFVQGRHRTGSVGLGLSIARDLVAAHGSELRVRSRPGATTFWFDLERACSAAGARAASHLREQVAT